MTAEASKTIHRVLNIVGDLPEADPEAEETIDETTEETIEEMIEETIEETEAVTAEGHLAQTLVVAETMAEIARDIQAPADLTLAASAETKSAPTQEPTAVTREEPVPLLISAAPPQRSKPEVMKSEQVSHTEMSSRCKPPEA